jgi:UDPglucose--hexose-1-phosphate uridylyltransferase
MIDGSQLRQDIVSGDWIVVAPKRFSRPDQFAKFLKKGKRIKAPKKGCPFEDPEKSGHERVLIYTNGKGKDHENWKVQIVKNKYPAFEYKDIIPDVVKSGPYNTMPARGYQDVVITRDHDKNFPNVDKKTAFLVFKAFQDRYKMLAFDRCLAYVLIFNNWGPRAGASIYHPHYQIFGIPIVPPDVEHSFNGSLNYYKKHKKCVHCLMIDCEKRNKTRVIYENKGAIAFAPFVSRQPFEIRIFPKRHIPYFEDTSAKDLVFVVEALQKSLLKIEKKLGDPDYIFFIHTSPIAGKEKYKHYHWHIEILPLTSIPAGFEFGTGIDINVVDPDEAAKILKA